MSSLARPMTRTGTSRRPPLPRRARALAASCLLVALAGPAVSPASERPAEDWLASATVAELKLAYLACSRAAVGGQLSSAGLMHCSVVYETLKRRAFDGDFRRLLEWSRSKPSRPPSTR